MHKQAVLHPSDIVALHGAFDKAGRARVRRVGLIIFGRSSGVMFGNGLDQRGSCLLSGNTVNLQLVIRLEGTHRGFGCGAELTVNAVTAVIVAELHKQAVLKPFDGFAAHAAPDGLGRPDIRCNRVVSDRNRCVAEQLRRGNDRIGAARQKRILDPGDACPFAVAAAFTFGVRV